MDTGSKLTHPGVRAIIGRIRQLPARPQVFSRLQVAMARPDATARELAGIVAEVFAHWPEGMRHAAVNLEDLQLQAQRTAAVALAITRGTRFSDDTVLAALLHDIGYWVLVQECPRELEQAVELALAAGVCLPQAESEILGTSHAQIGAYLLAIWGLPYAVVEAVAHHHQPSRVPARLDALSGLAVAMALTGGDDTDGCARNLAPSPVVGADYLHSLDGGLTWQEAEARAKACLERIARESN